MDIEILEMAERKAKFILKNSSPAMANALRRTLLSDIPKMAIDKVEFHLGPIMYDDKEYESVTPLFDEIIAHRLEWSLCPPIWTSSSRRANAHAAERAAPTAPSCTA